MKRHSPLLLLAVAAGPAFAQPAAQPDSSLVETAHVRSSTPVYSEVQVPHTECTTQTTVTERTASPKTNLAGAGIGAVAGGLLGHTVGSGNGKTAATAVGAVAGALVGNQLANRETSAQPEQVASEHQNCKTVNETQSRLMGFRVRYEYGGREFESMVRENPGKTIPVRVSVLPVEAR